LTALSRQEPDRVPVWVTVVAELAEQLGRAVGIPADPLDAYLTNRISHAALLTALGNDVVGIGSTAPPSRPTRERPDGFLEDEWGFVYRRVPHAFGIYLEIVGRPLAGITLAKELARYRLPDPAALTHGFGAEVAARVTGAAWGALRAGPGRVAGADVPIPYNRTLENAALPDVDQIVETVRGLLA